MNAPQSELGDTGNPLSSISRYVYEIVQQGIFRFPTDPRMNDPPGSSGIKSRSVSPCSEDEYNYDYSYGLVNRSTSGKPGRTTETPVAEPELGFLTTREKQLLQSKLISILADKYAIEQAETRQQILEQMIPELQWVASDAARREVEKLISTEHRNETEEEKIAGVLDRVKGLSKKSLESLFTTDTIIDILKRVVVTLEMEKSEGEWVSC